MVSGERHHMLASPSVILVKVLLLLQAFLELFQTFHSPSGHASGSRNSHHDNEVYVHVYKY